MKLQFTSQAYQEEAVSAVVDLFHGEGDIARKYVRHAGALLDGVGNALPVSPERIQANLHAVQRRNRLPLTDDADRMGFSVEMETGTGKTYVYLKTIYRLHEQYGFSKFVIVVPSIAIREGVQKFFEMTHEHFQTLFNRPPIRWFVYNSARLVDVSEFAHSPSIEVMIINIDAFRKSENIIHQPTDRMNSGRAIDLIRDVRPVVIIDEPQSVDNTPKAKEAVSWLNPLVTLRYSATHREKINLVYRLTPVDAYQQGLVKQISVSSIAAIDGYNHPYLRLVGVDNTSGFKARVEMDIKGKAGKVARTIKTLTPGTDLFLASSERELYRGWLLTDIDCLPGAEKIVLSGAHVLPLGQAMGDVSPLAIKRGQIRRAVEIHLDKELRLNPLGIKVLTLFFIDQVDRYRLHDGPQPQKGEYATMFEEEYRKLAALPKYTSLFEARPSAQDPATAHDGYFSKDKKGQLKNTRGDTADDQDTYALIMRDKEKLLSFDTPLRFIFSHSALKEGWDNPNVFQVCTLLEQTSALTARQKIGRGLRLCVNQQGERIHDRQINTLHVVASEHFAEFADNLQHEIEQETGLKFGSLDLENFLHIDVPVELAQELGLDITEPITDAGDVSASLSEESVPPSGSPAKAETPPSPLVWSAEPELPAYTPPLAAVPPATVKLGHEGARQVLQALSKQGVIDKKGRITAAGRDQIEKGTLALPPAYQPIANPIIVEIRRANIKLVVRDASKEVVVRKKKQVFLSPEFQEIWERIRQKTLYRVKMDREHFIALASEKLREKMPKILPARIVQSNADIDVRRSGVTSRETAPTVMTTLDHRGPLPDLLAILMNELGLRMSTLREILLQSGRDVDFLVNPERFIEEAVALLRDAKAEMIIDGIRYLRLAGQEYSVQEIFDKDELIGYLDGNAVPVDHSVYDHVITDHADTEKRFARDLDADPDVKLFFKLPPHFQIDTPLGGYNPDWAVLLEIHGDQRLYFVLETKGSTRELDLRGQERIKTLCGKRHFQALDAVTYEIASDWKKVKVELSD